MRFYLSFSLQTLHILKLIQRRVLSFTIFGETKFERLEKSAHVCHVQHTVHHDDLVVESAIGRRQFGVVFEVFFGYIVRVRFALLLEYGTLLEKQ